MYQVAEFIVKRRISFLIIFLISCFLCLFAATKVDINYDLSRYLPGDSPTKIALDVMEEEFGINGRAMVIVEKVTPEQALNLTEELKVIDGVLAAQFENSIECYKDGNALIQITLAGGDYSENTPATVNLIKRALSGYQIEMYGSSVHASRQLEDVSKQMTLILALSIPIFFTILFLTANSYAEIVVFGLVAGVSVLLNKGTNIFLGDISFVTNSISIVLQLALAMDYSIILLHRFEEEKADHPKQEAIARALSNSFSSISASSLTTIVGLIAIMFMQYTIGYDIGMVLAKSILCSMLTVFFFMPGVLLMFSKGIDKTKHKTFIPNLKFISKYVIKTRFFMPVIFILVIVVAFSLQSHNTYSFRFETDEATSHADLFGKSNTLVIIVPKGDNAKERAIIDLMKDHDFVNGAEGISGLGLRDQLLTEAFASRTGLDFKTAKGIYAYYAMNVGQIHEKIPFDQLLAFMLDNHDDLGLSTDEYTNLIKITNLWNNKELMLSASYLGRILSLTPEEATFDFAVYEMHQNSKSYHLAALIDYLSINGEQLGLSPAELESVNEIKSIIDQNDRLLTSKEASSILDIPENEANWAYTLYEMSLGKQDYGLGDIIQFINLNANDDSFEPSQRISINQAMDLIQNKNTLLEAEAFGQLMSFDDTGSLYDYYNSVSGTSATVLELITIINFMKDHESAMQLTAEEQSQVGFAYALLNNLPVNADQFSSLTELPQAPVYEFYTRYGIGDGYVPASEKLSDVLNFLDQYPSLWMMTENEIAHIQYVTGVLNKSTADFNSGQLSELLDLEPMKVSTIMASYGLSNGHYVKPHNLISILPFLESHGGDLGLKEEQSTTVRDLNRILNDYQKEMSAEEFAVTVHVTSEKTRLLYGLYTINDTKPAFIFSEVILFLADNNALLGMDSPQADLLNKNKAAIEKAFVTFESDDFARLVFNLNLDADDPEAIKLVSDLRKDLKQYYDDYYVLGDSANILDVQSAFDRDVLYVNTFSIALILIILIFTFRSVIVPFLLVLIILGSIWINFSFSTLSDVAIIFLGYIIITAIQMGATIDYAIIITGRYKEFRREYDKYHSVTEAIRVSIPTLLTSGGILIVSGLCVGFVSTASSISNLGILIGRGAFISLIMVIFFLPQLLLICDKVVL